MKGVLGVRDRSLPWLGVRSCPQVPPAAGGLSLCIPRRRLALAP